MTFERGYKFEIPGREKPEVVPDREIEQTSGQEGTLTPSQQRWLEGGEKFRESPEQLEEARQKAREFMKRKLLKRTQSVEYIRKMQGNEQAFDPIGGRYHSDAHLEDLHDAIIYGDDNEVLVNE